jgi:hypothetical protein
MVERLNVRAARKHYLLVHQEKHYVAYAPTMAAPVAGGPLTISPRDWLSVVVTCCNNTVTMAGPKWIVNELEHAATGKVSDAESRPETECGQGVTLTHGANQEVAPPGRP